MNEACSAGTGSFIAEQGRKFAGIRDVVHLGQEAIAARRRVARPALLGVHAEIIDEAVSAGSSRAPSSPACTTRSSRTT